MSVRLLTLRTQVTFSGDAPPITLSRSHSCGRRSEWPASPLPTHQNEECDSRASGDGKIRCTCSVEVEQADKRIETRPVRGTVSSQVKECELRGKSKLSFCHFASSKPYDSNKKRSNKLWKRNQEQEYLDDWWCTIVDQANKEVNMRGAKSESAVQHLMTQLRQQEAELHSKKS